MGQSYQFAGDRYNRKIVLIVLQEPDSSSIKVIRSSPTYINYRDTSYQVRLYLVQHYHEDSN